MSTYVFNHTKKGDGSKRVFADGKQDYKYEDYEDLDLFQVDLLRYIDEQDYKDLKEFDNNSPFKHRKNVQKI